MAIQDKFLRGLLGSLVFYERNGKQISRVRARKVRVSPVTLARAASFGHASQLSSIFTFEFKRLLNLPKLPSLQQRLAGSISGWLGGKPLHEIKATKLIPGVENFLLNKEAKLGVLLRRELQLAGNTGESLQLAISSFQPADCFIAPVWTARVSFTIVAVSCKFSNPSLEQVGITNIEMAVSSDYLPAQQIDLKVKLNPGEMTIVVASLVFKGKTYDTKDGTQEGKWRPIEVIGAVYV